MDYVTRDIKKLIATQMSKELADTSFYLAYEQPLRYWGNFLVQDAIQKYLLLDVDPLTEEVSFETLAEYYSTLRVLSLNIDNPNKVQCNELAYRDLLTVIARGVYVAAGYSDDSIPKKEIKDTIDDFFSRKSTSLH
jgi:hypothetical protein